MVICSTASHVVHIRRTITEPSGCRSRSTACCVARRHAPEHVAATFPTGSGDAAAGGGGSIPGRDICGTAVLRWFFLAIVDLFCIRERVGRQRARPDVSPAIRLGSEVHTSSCLVDADGKRGSCGADGCRLAGAMAVLDPCEVRRASEGVYASACFFMPAY